MAGLVLTSLTRPDVSELMQRLQVPIWHEIPSRGYYLWDDGSRLSLKCCEEPDQFQITVDPEKAFTLFRQQKINFKKDILSRAIGFKGDLPFYVLDGTMGFGRDDFYFLSLGCEVTACEAHPVVYALMADVQPHFDLLKTHLKLHFGDTLDFLKNVTREYDCFYLDPMFENKDKKTKPKKEMAYLRDHSVIVSDTEDLIRVALERGCKRVVVKRPINGEYLVKKPNAQLKGKLIRYDIYTPLRAMIKD